MFGRLRAETLSWVTVRQLLAGSGYAAAGLLGVTVALATAGCGSGGNGALSTLRTSTLPSVTRPATTSPPAGETQTTVTLGTTTEAPAVPPVTVTETHPAMTETLPARIVTVTETQTLPVATETLPATTETLPAATITSTTVNPAAAAAAGAAVASAQGEETSETPWGWIAFAILATAVVVGALVLVVEKARGAQAARGDAALRAGIGTMATAPSERTRISRRAGRLVLGVDDRIASTVFGTITAMATVTVYGKAFPTARGRSRSSSRRPRSCSGSPTSIPTPSRRASRRTVG
jgi:hypothetical protein